MRLGLMVNDLKTEDSGYTTTRLAVAALARGHEAWVISAGDFAYGTDDRVYAQATMAPQKNYKGGKAYMAAIHGPGASPASRFVWTSSTSCCCAAILRPKREAGSGLRMRAFCLAALPARAGVIVLNDPNGLANAMNKMYFQLFPEEVRPKTLITRNRQDIRRFVDECGGKAVIKPLQGSGGQGVFLIDQTNLANLEPNDRRGGA